MPTVRAGRQHREQGPVPEVQIGAPSLLLAPPLFLEGGTWARQRWADCIRVSYPFIRLLLLPLPSTKKRGCPHSSSEILQRADNLKKTKMAVLKKTNERRNLTLNKQATSMFQSLICYLHYIFFFPLTLSSNSLRSLYSWRRTSSLILLCVQNCEGCFQI